jgi:hypothetical protein
MSGPKNGQDNNHGTEAGHEHGHGHGHGHGHDHPGQDHHDDAHSHDHPDEAGQQALTAAVEKAQSGLRTDVQSLLDLLTHGHLFVPLSDLIPGAIPGQDVELDGELSFRPHMLVHEDGSYFATAFTEPDLVAEVAEALGWNTSGEELQFVHLPAMVALDLSQAELEESQLAGIVLNPGDETELVLSRDEAASLTQGRALPLVGYVERLPEGMEAVTQIVEGADAPPVALLTALTTALSARPEVESFEVLTTYNPERDREPHLTLFVRIKDEELDRVALADDVMAHVLPHVPPPGYVDIVFRGPAS